MSADSELGATETTPKFPYILIQSTESGYNINGQVPDMGEVYKMLGIAQDFFRTAITKHEKIGNVNRSGNLLAKLRGWRR